MPKSFKTCPVRIFDKRAFAQSKVCLNEQPPLNEMKHVAVTTIRLSPATPGFEDFAQYVIEHDRVVKMAGRYGDVSFPEFTYTGVISGFFSDNRSLLLLSGKKADVLSFCAETARVAEV